MTSEELLERRREQQLQQLQQSQQERESKQPPAQENDENILLIDVRTKPEQEVSMIPGAITLSQLYDDDDQKEAQSLRQAPASGLLWDAISKDDKIVVTYCTIGYRSGLEARRLLDQYPQLDGRIYSLDGILMYTHSNGDLVVPVSEESAGHNGMEATAQMQEDQPLHPQQQQEPATQVHTFASQWESCANNDQYQPVFYGFPSILGRVVQVGALVVVRGSQRIYSTSCNCLVWCFRGGERRQILEKHH